MRPTWRRDGLGWKVVGKAEDLVPGAMVDGYLSGVGVRPLVVGEVKPCIGEPGYVFTRVTKYSGSKASKPLPQFELEQRRKAKVRSQLAVERANGSARRGPCDECGSIRSLVPLGAYMVCRPCRREKS